MSTIAIGALLGPWNAALAHHSRAMFDVARNVTLRGIVREYRWQNPHSHIVVAVEPDAGDAASVGAWDVEASATGLMKAEGWSPSTLKAGERITVVAHPARDGSHHVLLFYAIAADGTRLYRARHRYESEAE